MQGTLLYAMPDELLEEPKTNGGLRHFVKRSRWEVLSSPDGLDKGRWLESSEAKRMLGSGDFYLTGTIIKIYPAGLVVRVEGQKIYDVESSVEVEP